jgi:hypothetical protein
MDSGFITLKDFLEVVVIPIAIFAAGALLPRWFEAVKSRKFLALIRRELEEMGPSPEEPQDRGKWHEHLRKRFLHEEIFENVSENRDFILSLPPDIAYNVGQLWSHYYKATTSEADEVLAEHSASWCDYLQGLCFYFDKRKHSDTLTEVYEFWRRLVLDYHPDASATQRLQK